MHKQPTLPSRQRGVSLLEALIAFLLLSIGLIALSRLQTDLRGSAEAARLRTEAVRLAQLDLEQLRAFGDVAGWNAITDASADVTPAGSTTRYMLERGVQTSTEPALKAVRVELHWVDRHGEAQQLRLDSLIALHDPALAGALALPRPPFAAP